MIQQAATGLDSRTEANILNKEGFLPLITAPMYSVVNEHNWDVYEKLGIQVCMPRGQVSGSLNAFHSFSLEDFNNMFLIKNASANYESDYVHKVCIDTANGNMPKLHKAIIDAKAKYGKNIVIIAGNVGSEKAFVQLARTGVDYIRVGIGGGAGCNTTANTGVGFPNLEGLINRCRMVVDVYSGFPGYTSRWNFTKDEITNVQNVKIIADGISYFVSKCESLYSFNDNGYAAINKLLHSGADLVMIGKLFAQSLESAGEKRYYSYGSEIRVSSTGSKGYGTTKDLTDVINNSNENEYVFVKYTGMSTHDAQKTYRKDEKRPSEGTISLLKVRWKLEDWVNGNKHQDKPPYLMGWTNSLLSAMSYTGAKTLKEFYTRDNA